MIANIASFAYVYGETGLKEIGEWIFGEQKFTISDRQRILQQRI